MSLIAASERDESRCRTGSVRLDGCDLYYEDLGEGIPILLIHPAGSTASTWGSATDELARIGRVITYDRRGYARSGGEPVRSMSTHTADAAALLEHLRTPPAIVVGTSAGAAIAVDLAVRRPDLVRAAVAHELPWRFTRHLPTGSQVVALARIGSLALRGRDGDAAEALLRSAYTYRDGGTAWDAFPEEWRRAGRENARAALADFRNSIAEYPSAADLATVEVPVVCSYGARSPDSMFRLVRSLAAAIPTASTHRIEGAGHPAPFDAPNNFVQLIADTLTETNAHESARKEGFTMFEVTARLKVRDGELDGFKQQAAEIMRLAREKDTKTLRYDWFLSDDGTECEVREGYVDADALLEHHYHIEEAKAKLFRDFADDHDMTLYGEPSPALAEAMEAMAGAVTFRKYAFFQGLDAESKVLEEVPA
jgi:pimeloyl-ACP methyl ester carboxylesterase/quinol monooxygenase YgiN